MRKLAIGDKVQVIYPIEPPVILKIVKTTPRFAFTNTGIKFKRDYLCSGILMLSNYNNTHAWYVYKVIRSRQVYLEALNKHDFDSEETYKLENIVNYLKIII